MMRYVAVPPPSPCEKSPRELRSCVCILLYIQVQVGYRTCTYTDTASPDSSTAVVPESVPGHQNIFGGVLTIWLFSFLLHMLHDTAVYRRTAVLLYTWQCKNIVHLVHAYDMCSDSRTVCVPGASGAFLPHGRRIGPGYLFTCYLEGR